MTIEGKTFPYKRKLTALFSLAEQVLGEDFSNVVVSVNFVSSEEIQKLNNEFRKIDKKTDVLSFPNLNKTTTQKLAEFQNEVYDGQLFLGDIVICKDVARAQAKEYGHSMKREICFLALHGLLHLLGYDHIEKDDEKLMQKTADEILNKFGVLR